MNSLLLLAIGVVLAMIVVVAAGIAIRRWVERRGIDGKMANGDGLEGYVLSAVLGLLALLMGFTFSLAVDRFETRRALVLEEANAIGTVYLRTQLLAEPHRGRISRLLVAYTGNRIALAKARPGANRTLMATNDRLLVHLWAATTSAVDTMGNPGVTGAYLTSMNQLIDLDAARKTARTVRVPTVVFVVLFVYLMAAGGVIGYAFVGARGRGAAAVMLILLTLSLLLIVDIDRPSIGGVREDQGPMERLYASFETQPPAVFDRYRREDAKAAPALRPSTSP